MPVNRCLTCGVDAEIPLEIQLFLWSCYDRLPPEREQTLQRQREGITIAKAQGKYKGRQPIPIDWVKFGQLYEQWKDGRITAVEFQNKIGMKPNTFYRRIKQYEKNNRKRSVA